MSLSSVNHAAQLLSRILQADSPTEPVCVFPPAKPGLPALADACPLPRATPEECGVSSRRVAAFLQALQDDPTLRMHSLLLVRDGKIFCEAAFGPRDTVTPRHTFSACKSVTALAVGCAMDDGLLAPEDPVADFFPDECGPVSRRLFKDLTVEHLLSMRSSTLFNEAGSMTRPDWVRGFFALPGLGDQGKRFQYNSLNTYLLAALVCRRTGRTLSDYLDERIFRPLGIADHFWETSPEGIEKGGWGLYLSPESLAKLGLLVLQGGLWQGRQLLSEAFLTRATTAQVSPPPELGDYDYGWQFWVGRKERSFLFNGMLGQNVLGCRDSGVILVSHAGNDENFQQSRYFDLARDYFAGELPAPGRDAGGPRLLQKTLAALAAAPGRLPRRGEAEPFLGRRFVADDPAAASTGLVPLLVQALENAYTHGLEAISIGGTAHAPELFYEERDAIHRLRVGLEAPIRQVIRHQGNQFLAAVQGRFTHDADENPVLRLQIEFLETPSTRVLKLILTPAGPRLQQDETPGADFVTGMTALFADSPAFRAVAAALVGAPDPDYLDYRIRRVFQPDLKLRDMPWD